MKYFLLILPIFALFVACFKDPVPPDTPPAYTPVIELGHAQVTRADTVWNLPLQAWLQILEGKPYFTIGCTTHPFLPKMVESFSVSDIPVQEDKFSVEFDKSYNRYNSIPQAGIVWIYDWDQLIGSMWADTTRPDNFIEIIRYDSIARTIEGRFSIHFIEDDDTNFFDDFGIPHSISLTDGVFHLKLEE